MATKKVISQSKTQYIKKGQKLSDGSVAKKGYVARKGNDLKKVTANIKLETETRGKKAGTVVKAQRKANPVSKGGGKTPAQLKAEAAARAKAAKIAKEKAAREKLAAAAKKVADAKKAKAMAADKSNQKKSPPKGSSPVKENKPSKGTKYSKSVGSQTPFTGKVKATNANSGPKEGDTRNNIKGKQVFKSGKWVRA